MKKILCLIDALGPGGAERQMVGLASMLYEAGYDIQVWYHEPKDFFVEELNRKGIKTCYIDGNKSTLTKIYKIRRAIKEYEPDTVIAYLQASSMIASVIRLSGIKYHLIVSERNTNRAKSLRDSIRFNLFRVADYVVPNSYSQADFITKNYGFLKHKVKTIVNFVDTDVFQPKHHERGTEILVAATLWPSKNAVGLINALKLLKEKGVKCHVKWFGKVHDQEDYALKCEDLIAKYELRDYIELLNKTKDINTEYQKADYFCLPSFYEGTPNVICEAMASGLPVLCSNVCDNGLYVRDGVNGYLFDPTLANDISSAIEKAITSSDEVYRQWRGNSRLIATENLAASKFFEKYSTLI